MSMTVMILAFDALGFLIEPRKEKNIRVAGRIQKVMSQLAEDKGSKNVFRERNKHLVPLLKAKIKKLRPVHGMKLVSNLVHGNIQMQASFRPDAIEKKRIGPLGAKEERILVGFQEIRFAGVPQ